MVIQIIDEDHIGTIECESHPPITVHPDRPVAFKATVKRMEFVSGRIQIICLGGHIQRSQQVAYPCRMLGPDACFRPCFCVSL